MRHPLLSRALLGILLVSVLFAPAGCSRGCSEKSPPADSRPASDSRIAAAAADDPNAENPDKNTWVDLATKPFDPKLVGGRFVQVRQQILPSLNAVSGPASADAPRIHKYLIGAPLLMEKPDRTANGFEVAPHGAASMPEDTPDHSAQIWTLRGDLTWEDGRPVTAKDYAFTFAKIRDPEFHSRLAAGFQAVLSVEALDARRFRVRWSKPDSRAIYAIGLDLPVVPEHAVPHDAPSFRQTNRYLSCGPYRVVDFSNSRLELVLRDEYRSRPFPIRPNYVERFVYETGPQEPLAVLTRLINREAHLAVLTGDQYATDAESPAFRRAAWRSHFVMPTYGYIAWNLRDPADPSRPHPILGDVRVRRALSHLLPVEAIAASSFHGLARPVSGPFDARDPGYDPAIQPFEFDRARAQALLLEAGWSPGEDGRLAKDGHPLRIKLSRWRETFAPIALAFQEEARKIGAIVDLDVQTDYDALRAHKLDAGLIYWQLDAVEPDIASQWHSRGAATDSDNYSGFVDAEADRLLDRHQASPDPKERAALRRALHARLHEEVPATFLLAPASTIGVSKDFANVFVHDLGVRFHDFVLRDLWEKRQR